MSSSRMHAGMEPGISPTPGAYEQVFVPHLGDVLRLAILLAIPTAWLHAAPLPALVMLFVAGGTWVLRYYASSRRQDLAGQFVLLLAGAFSVLGTYKTIGLLDIAIHFAVLCVLSLLIYDMLVHHGILPPEPGPQGALGALLMTLGMGALCAVSWEVGEWIGHEFISNDIGVGYADTMGDLCAGMLGSLAAVFWIRRTSSRRYRS